MWVERTLQIVGAILAMYGFWQLITLPIARIWPNRDKFLIEFKHATVTTSPIELQRVIREKDKRLYWTSPEPQSVGDSLRIDFGKYRVIDGIEFYEKIPDNQIPKQWTLLLEDDFGGLVDRPIDGKGRIVTEFPPRKVHAIEVKVREPLRFKADGIPYNWRISIVYLREVKIKLLCWSIKRKI